MKKNLKMISHIKNKGRHALSLSLSFVCPFDSPTPSLLRLASILIMALAQFTNKDALFMDYDWLTIYFLSLEEFEVVNSKLSWLQV